MVASVFGWEYPPGSMRGSGIYVEESDESMVCDSEECGGKEQAGTTVKNDWGNLTWYCGTCDAEQDVEPDEPDYEPLDDGPECPQFYDGTGRFW